MNYGFENDKWYIDYTTCTRPVGNMRQESDRRAVEIANTSSKIMISLSGGLDSQSVLHSFYTQDIPVECAFLYLPGYNDNEYQNLKIIEKKYGIKAHIVDFDPYDYQDEIEEESMKHDIQPNSIIQKKFLSLLPGDYDFVSITHDPFISIDIKERNTSWFFGYNTPEVARQRAFDLVDRKGKYIFFGDTSEFLTSILSEEIVHACIFSWPYFLFNGLSKPGVKLATVDRWDYYIKPLVYGKYWRDELLYFPKFAGFERVPFLQTPLRYKEHAVKIPLREFLMFLRSNTGETKRYFENVPYDDE
jgi:hypothetical protein